jgi:EAL domain-containing protein (putative c-di-GMP-specific phosphodiesterase class I)
VKENKLENRIAWYLDISESIQRKRMIANCLKKADYNRDLSLNFQPVFRIDEMKLIGMEALLRWTCPDSGSVSPAEFIPIAEQENLIIPIGNWVIENAVRQIAKWNTAYHTQLRIGINFSPKQFDQESSFAVLDASIKQYQAASEWIDIEITEGVALDFENSSEKIKKHLKNKGVTISIDDFGTGYSSMGYLSILSFDTLKIAKELIDKITFDESSRKIVTSIIMLAKSLELKTLAEGVETKEQFDLLLELGCDQIQGYYLGKPVSAEEFETRYLKHQA